METPLLPVDEPREHTICFVDADGTIADSIVILHGIAASVAKVITPLAIHMRDP